MDFKASNHYSMKDFYQFVLYGALHRENTVIHNKRLVIYNPLSNTEYEMNLPLSTIECVLTKSHFYLPRHLTAHTTKARNK